MFQAIRVSMPYSFTYANALSFLNEKRTWVLQQQKKNQTIEKQYTISDLSTLQSKFHQFKIISYNKKQLQIHWQKEKITLYISQKQDILAHDFQKQLKELLVAVYRKEAKSYLPQRVATLAKKYAFSYKRVVIKNMKSRWGSCSSLGNINLNLHLLRLPDTLIDYVILHELAHTQHPNHSKHFWNKLTSILKNAKQLDKQLASFHPLAF